MKNLISLAVLFFTLSVLGQTERVFIYSGGTGDGSGLTNLSAAATGWASNSVNGTLTNVNAGGVSILGPLTNTGALKTTTNFVTQVNVNGAASGANAVNVTGNAAISGNVGIGTTGPDVNLAVGSTLLTAQGLTGAVLNLGGSTAQRPGINIGQDSTHALSLYWTGNATPGNTVAVVETAGNLNDLIINNVITVKKTSGNVGIGTTAPAARLDVTGDIRASTTISATNGFATWTNSAVGPFAITFPATTVLFTNPVAINTVLYIDNTGVTATAINKNGQQIFAVPAITVTLLLKPGDYFSETYSAGTPSARWEAQ